MPESVRLAPRTHPLDLLCVFSLLKENGQRRVIDQLVIEMAKRFGRNVDLSYRAKRQRKIANGIRMVLEGYGVPERLDYLAQALDPVWLEEYRSHILPVAEAFGTLGCILSDRRMYWNSAQMVRLALDLRVPREYKEAGTRVVEFIEEFARSRKSAEEQREDVESVRDEWRAFFDKQPFPQSGETVWFVDVVTRLIDLAPGGAEVGPTDPSPPGRYNNWHALIAEISLWRPRVLQVLWQDALRVRMWTIEPEPSLVSVDTTLASFKD